MWVRKLSSSCLASWMYTNPSLASDPLSHHTTSLTLCFLQWHRSYKSLMHHPYLAHVPISHGVYQAVYASSSQGCLQKCSNAPRHLLAQGQAGPCGESGALLSQSVLHQGF